MHLLSTVLELDRYFGFASMAQACLGIWKKKGYEQTKTVKMGPKKGAYFGATGFDGSRTVIMLFLPSPEYG